MVEQWDTDTFNRVDLTPSNGDATWYMPSIHTKTWFHTGAYVEGREISLQFAHEYFGAPHNSTAFNTWARDILLEDSILPTFILSAPEIREACRSLKGTMLRQEIYADDDLSKAQFPYVVTEQNFTISLLQPVGNNRHAVFFTHPRESISYHYERNIADPRVAHTLTLEVDAFGNVLRSVTVGYSRTNVQHQYPEQNATHLLFFINRFVNNDARTDSYRVGLPVEARTYDIVKPPAENPRFSWDDMNRLMMAMIPADQLEPPAALTIPYEQWNWRESWNPQTELGGVIQGGIPHTRLRLIEHTRTLYRKDNLTGLSPLGIAGTLALKGEQYKLVFTSGLVNAVFVATGKLAIADVNTTVGNDSGYVHTAGDLNWWIPSGKTYYSPSRNISPGDELAFAQDHFFLPHRFQDPFGQETVITYDSDPTQADRNHNLLLVQTEDTLGNRVTVDIDDDAGNRVRGIDYRVLQPDWVADANENRTRVKFDGLGMVVASAIMGKAGEGLGDNLDNFEADLTQAQVDNFYNHLNPHSVGLPLLNNATTRVIYDLHRFYRSRGAHPTDATQWSPPFAATLARETHTSDLQGGQQSNLHISFSYSDGFGREIQRKIQAEAGSVNVVDAQGTHHVIDTAPNLRWVGSGWTIFNNKGKPVREFEPFFSAHHGFQFDVRIGVSPILVYDPLERVVVTLHPNHTYEKVIFDAWQQTVWDVNDTIEVRHNSGDPAFDPRDDVHVGQYFQRLPIPEYLATWYDLRTDPTKALARWPDIDSNGQPLPGNAQRRAAEKAAAQNAAQHTNTPATTYLDSLGRAFLTVVNNGLDLNGNTLLFPTKLVLDIEGNQRKVIDAKNRIVMLYDYDLISNRIYQSSVDAGQRWMLNDVTGKPIREWDERAHERIYTYDPLRRMIEARVKGGDGSSPLDHVYEKIVYGENQSLQGRTDKELNLRGQPFEHYDTAGKLQFEAYDFKGNLRRSHRRLSLDYKNTPDWDTGSPNSLLEPNSHPSRMEYDALNRVTKSFTPDGSTTNFTYNAAGLLENVDVLLHDGSQNHFVTGLSYNARGQRVEIVYGNSVVTRYDYESETFRLQSLITTQTNGKLLQDLRYTYDPAGNITQIEDCARPTIFFNNHEMVPVNEFFYDPLYRLTRAHGREHIAQVGFDQIDNWHDGSMLKKYSASNPMAWRTYIELYGYDAVGNIKQMRHSAQGGDWTREYADYNINNRLQFTTIGPLPTYTYTYSHHAQHGFMNAMPHLSLMEWNFRDELQAVAQQQRNNGLPEITYYVYDFNGQRIRKVTEASAVQGARPSLKKETLYIGQIEIYREYTGTYSGLVRNTLHVMDDKKRIAMVETRKEIDDGSPIKLIRYQFGNHIGTVSLETDENGRVISYEEYHPYGTTAYQAVDADIKAAAKRYRYSSKERDEESGFYYHESRYYAPWLGRWISCDPVFLSNQSSLYSYVSGNPITHTDVGGHYDPAAFGRSSGTESHQC